ncbi:MULTISPECIES: DUF4148 domain-containing protein [unclassified Cupriavidus]|uniref:DUF4148 domain-containing protein n=1 Tax=unclassified Cupriavidus TaxID=2640874 RepID=UPI0019205541|nr:DUF4148 domain-containing protein [Cupriavidus sp. SW-Y-13]
MKTNHTLRNVVATLGLVVAGLSVCHAHTTDSSQGLTRAQVQSELSALEKLGYDPHREGNYPADLQAAEARLAEQHANNVVATK